MANSDFFSGLRRDFGPWSRFLRAHNRCFDLIDEKLALSRQQGPVESTCLVDDWVMLRNAEGKPLLSDGEIRENILAFLLPVTTALPWR